jgi:hypothetical protein
LLGWQALPTWTAIFFWFWILPGTTSASCDHWRWIRSCRWVCDQASQNIPQIPPAGPQTGHLKMQRVLFRNRHMYQLVLSHMSTHKISISCSA